MTSTVLYPNSTRMSNNKMDNGKIYEWFSSLEDKISLSELKIEELQILKVENLKRKVEYHEEVTEEDRDNEDEEAAVIPKPQWNTLGEMTLVT